MLHTTINRKGISTRSLSLSLSLIYIYISVCMVSVVTELTLLGDCQFLVYEVIRLRYICPITDIKYSLFINLASLYIYRSIHKIKTRVHTPHTHTHTHTHTHIYIYIYIYICVCVCVCVCARFCFMDGQILFYFCKSKEPALGNNQLKEYIVKVELKIIVSKSKSICTLSLRDSWRCTK